MSHKVQESSYYHTKIKEWPEEERPREKLLNFGPQHLSDAELLALLIESGTGGITAVDLAKRLLVEHEDLAKLSSIGIIELSRMKGIGPARSARILAAFELGRRVEGGKIKGGVRMTSPAEVAKFFSPEFRGLKKEIFKAVLLDSGNRIIRNVTVSQGTLNMSVVHPREVFKPAVDHLAAGIILLHNHPSGEPDPSQMDRQITRQLTEAGEVMGIPVVDHIILADNRYFSFAKEGLLKQVRRNDAV
jgi:DNA repair protein RadC